MNKENAINSSINIYSHTQSMYVCIYKYVYLCFKPMFVCVLRAQYTAHYTRINIYTRTNIPLDLLITNHFTRIYFSYFIPSRQPRIPSRATGNKNRGRSLYIHFLPPPPHNPPPPFYYSPKALANTEVFLFLFFPLFFQLIPFNGVLVKEMSLGAKIFFFFFVIVFILLAFLLLPLPFSYIHLFIYLFIFMHFLPRGLLEEWVQERFMKDSRKVQKRFKRRSERFLKERLLCSRKYV